MLLSIWTEYYDFFVILISVVSGMFLAYFIFFRPRNPHGRRKNEYEPTVSDDLEESPQTMAEPEESLGDEEESDIDESDETITEESETLDEETDLEEESDNDFEMGENSNIFESLEPVDSIDDLEDVVPALGIEIVHEDDDYVEVVEEVEEEPERIQIFGNYDLRPDIDAEQQIDEIIEDVLKLSDQTPANLGGKYHVLYHKKDKKWYVKREGEGVVGDSLLTQHEAIAFATIQALKNDTTIVVHDKDGRISKYKF